MNWTGTFVFLVLLTAICNFCLSDCTTMLIKLAAILSILAPPAPQRPTHSPKKKNENRPKDSRITHAQKGGGGGGGRGGGGGMVVTRLVFSLCLKQTCEADQMC